MEGSDPQRSNGIGQKARQAMGQAAASIAGSGEEGGPVSRILQGLGAVKSSPPPCLAECAECEGPSLLKAMWGPCCEQHPTLLSYTHATDWGVQEIKGKGSNVL